MEMDLFLQIKTAYNTFSASHKKLANFILENPEYILQNSISDVATTCHIGEATVSRFCKILGYKGYHDFKISIARGLSENTVNGTGDSSSEEGNSITKAQLLLDMCMQALSETYQLLDAKRIENAVELLASANHIMFLGIGNSLVSAMRAYVKFLRITSNVSINTESHMQYMAASLLSPGDVAMVFSHSGSTKETVELAKKAKERGAAVICITRYQKSPLTKYSDVTLLYSSDEQFDYGFSVSAASVQNYLINLLFVHFFHSSQEKFQKNKDDASQLLLDKMY